LLDFRDFADATATPRRHFHFRAATIAISPLIFSRRCCCAAANSFQPPPLSPAEISSFTALSLP